MKPRFLALILDMDGTITRPTLDFHRIRAEIGLPPGDLTEVIAALPEPEQARAWQIIEAHEEAALHRQELQEGCAELLEACRANGMRIGVLTRNTQVSVDHLCARFDLCFDAALTREFPHMKPHPAPILHMLAQWQISPAAAIMVGDYVHDLECGRAAGTTTCFFRNAGCADYSDGADYTVSSMLQLQAVLFDMG
jgi:HAD superfamily hydrolase (TIGR01549 family)